MATDGLSGISINRVVPAINPVLSESPVCHIVIPMENAGISDKFGLALIRSIIY
jgi:hypothetical protein